MQATELNARLKERNITMELTDAALDAAVAQSYDHLYGARPLRRWLEHNIVTQLSRMIITGELRDDSRVVVDAPAAGGVGGAGLGAGGSGLTFAVQRDEAAAAARAENKQASKKLRLLSGDLDWDDGEEDGMMED
jgi:ATP-dependent Clp protease ATP-binding subunit ClpB